jgi:lysosomal Pro-X carboxypeptidase
MTRNGVTDMFFEQAFDLAGVAAGCRRQWGVSPRPEWATINYGGWRLKGTSNIVWSNGGLDPWRGGGVTRNISSSLLAITIPNVGHHMDLMFSDPRDPPAVKAARDFERTQIRKWVAQVEAR